MTKIVKANKKVIMFIASIIAIISVVLLSVYIRKPVSTENAEYLNTIPTNAKSSEHVDNTRINAESGEYLNGIPITRLHATFVIDTENLSELVGDMDYVFVAEVVSEDGTEHKFVASIPHTNYSVKIVENIKGELVTDTIIPIQKVGGLFEDGSMYELYENDELPVVGETYIFYAYAQEDGSLLISGPNSNTKMDISNDIQLSDLEEEAVEEVLETSDEYIEVEDALDTQVVRDREHFESIYEEE